MAQNKACIQGQNIKMCILCMCMLQVVQGYKKNNVQVSFLPCPLATILFATSQATNKMVAGRKGWVYKANTVQLWMLTKHSSMYVLVHTNRPTYSTAPGTTKLPTHNSTPCIPPWVGGSTAPPSSPTPAPVGKAPYWLLTDGRRGCLTEESCSNVR